MLFNSFEYILIFFPCVVLLVFLSRKMFGPLAAQLCVLAASVFFYTWSKPSNLIYLAGSILVNWQLGLLIARTRDHWRKYTLQLGLVLNIGFLCIFKYLNFFLKSIPFLSNSHILLPDFSFPLGISFFTLMQIMYIVDVYDGLLDPSNLLDHATFVSFFPYVISGPVAKAKRLRHQFGHFGGDEETRAPMMARGLYQFTVGLFKKVVFAFIFGHVADSGFAVSNHLSAVECWIFSIAYTLQIYFDFSGYSDMAIGSALMLGVEIPRNFDAPLRSKSIIEFWQRWHISLSNFITSYLYTPILKSFERATLATASIATLIAMTIAGLWHGPSWTFVLFGLLHGIGLVTNQYWRKKKMPKLNWFPSWLLTFILVDIAFIFFRSPTVPAGAIMARNLFNPRDAFATDNWRAMHDGFSLKVFGLPMLAGCILAVYGKASDQMAHEFKRNYRTVAAVTALMIISWLFMNSTISQSFVYFKF